MIINIQDDILKLQALGLLNKILLDKTTKRHIIWATDAYMSLGTKYGYHGEITPDLIVGRHASVIKTRAWKAMELQAVRTRQHAEVFTPLWMCKKMNDYADEAWFRANGPFLGDETPTAAAGVPRGKNWGRYVDSRRLEITCGEAPYLVNRYDTETGEVIPIQERSGLLDRKLRAVSENAQTESEWLEWAVRAFGATYGYELQGDNVLIARINLLMTFEEYLQECWKRQPTRAEYRTIANIVVWNIWQMDGLNGTPPHGIPTDASQPVDRVAASEAERPKGHAAQPYCRIHNWVSGKSAEFSSSTASKKKAWKFDFIIGNPPYQKSLLNTSDKPLYNDFMDASYQLSDEVELITPARFLFDAGKTPKAWNRKMLNDEFLQVLYYEPDSSKIFPNTQIKGGIAVTYHNKKTRHGSIGCFTPYPTLNAILHKVKSSPDFSSICNIIVTSFAYHYTEKMHMDYPEAIGLLSNGHAYDLKSNAFERLPMVFLETRPDDGHDYIRILGRLKNERTYKYIRRDYVTNVKNLDKYKLFIPKANGAGIFGEILALPELCGPGVGSTESFVGIGLFSTAEESKNALKYLKAKFTRAMLGTVKITQDLTPQKWKYVPLQDFSPGSDIDWSRSIPEIDRQLYKKYRLSAQEIQFIESHVKEML